ncbi:MAG TPA: TonB-dependent receptor [Caulobacteraceae bacterium]|nr:TonB-dependent receptor [Caulobacteraceae bacterium]
MTRIDRLKCASSLIAIAIGMGGGGAALAQGAAAEASAGGDQTEVSAVVVTGSRVAKGATAPTPVTAVTPDTINQVEQPNIADALVQLPSLRTSNTAAQGGQGARLGSALNLRGLSSLRTLTLVNGQRFVPTMQFGLSTGNQAVNIESIPQGLIRRVDVVTGGASAAYGSDAVAGVVNFILDEDFQGFKAEVTAGQTARNDAQNFAAEMSAGAAFAGGRGHVLIDAEFARDLGVPNDPFGLRPARPWQADSQTIGSESIAGHRVLVHGARYWQYPLNGLVDGCLVGGTISNGVVTGGSQKGLTACPVYGVGFDDLGLTDHPYDFGVRNDPVRSRFAVGGEGARPGAQTVIDNPSIRHLLYGRVSYDVTPKTNVYLDVLSHQTLQKPEAGAGTPQFVDTSRVYGFEIAQDNPFLPPDLLARMQASNVSAINLSKLFYFNVQQSFEARTDRYSVGLRHQINDNWSADAYYTYGVIHSTMTLNNFSNVNHLYNALHAVRATSAGPNWAAGDIVCASTLAGGLDGCVPWNPFGRQLMTPEQQHYINPTDYYFSTNSQEVAEATVRGSAFSLPAGPVEVAFGAGYRKESVDRTSDALGLSQLPNAFNPRITGALIYLNNPAISGSTNLWEGFGEAEVPILKDRTLVQSLDANFAGRYTDYSNGGGVTTWKAGLTYVPVQGLRFRAAYSRDVRAPNLVELFSPPSSGFSSVSDPRFQGQQFTFAPLSVGNPDLKPEEANTLTLGVVLRPTFWPSVYASVDYWQIEMQGQIATRGAQSIVNECEGANGVVQVLASCNLITRSDSTGQIVSILLPTANLSSSKLRGVDVELGFNHPIDFYFLKGDIGLHSFITYTIENSSVSVAGATPVNTAPQPNRLTLLATGDYRVGGWTFGVQEHFNSRGRRSVTVARYEGDELPSTAWTDVIVRHNMGKYEVFGTVQNVFDRDPPHNYFTAPNSGSASSGGDPLGRRFQFGVKVKL